MEHDLPPVNLEETLDITESHLEHMEERVEKARGALQNGAEEEAWKQYRELVDDLGDFFGNVITDIQDLAPAEYFPNGLASIFDIEPPSPSENEVETREFDPHEFDPHDYESRENIRQAIRGASSEGSLNVMKLGLMFAPPDKFIELSESKEDLRESLDEVFWGQIEGMTPGQLERELQAAERAADNAAAKLLDYAANRRDTPPSVTGLWGAAWKAELLNDAIILSTFYWNGLPEWEELNEEERGRLQRWPKSLEELSEAARDALRGVHEWADGRPKRLWPEHKQELYGLAGEEVGRDGWGKDNPERPQNALEGYLRRNTYNVPSGVEELVKLARSTLNGH